MKVTLSLFVATVWLWTLVDSKSIGDFEFISPDSEGIIETFNQLGEITGSGSKMCTFTSCCPEGFRCVDGGRHCFSFPWYIQSTPCEGETILQ